MLTPGTRAFFSCRARPLVLCLRVHAAITTNASVASLPWSYQAFKPTSLPWHPFSSSVDEHVSAHSRSSTLPTLRCKPATAINDHGQVRTDFAWTPQLVESLIPPHATRRPMPRQKYPSRDSESWGGGVVGEVAPLCKATLISRKIVN